MNQYLKEFIRRGVAACSLGPLVLAILYIILWNHGMLESLTIPRVCTGIFSLTALAFVAGGMNSIYQVEQLPLMFAILIHGCVLYVSYLATYLINGWLEWGVTPILVFSVIFIAGFLGIWAVIYPIIKLNTRKLNQILKEKQRNTAFE